MEMFSETRKSLKDHGDYAVSIKMSVLFTSRVSVKNIIVF